MLRRCPSILRKPTMRPFTVCAFYVVSFFFSSVAMSSEATLRAAYIYNFIKFIHWPDDSGSDELRLCVLKANIEARSAIKRLQGRKANKRTIELSYIDSQDGVNTVLAKCHMLYQPLSTNKLKLPKRFPVGVVLVVDEPRLFNPNIGITLTKSQEGRIEFGLNAEALAHAGVEVSSQLMKLSKPPNYGSSTQ